MFQRISLMVGRHEVVLTSRDGRWTATIDGLEIAGVFETSADAWTAAVNEAERLEEIAAAARLMRR
ncbi:MAG TPA: hypothetical protein VFM53_09240 [Anaeromyxobacteraceae bacterium]|nr:hypothetical protein [Anaeromyxobacteraceae bacterium]